MDFFIISQFFKTKIHGVPTQRLEAEAVKMDGFFCEKITKEDTFVTTTGRPKKPEKYDEAF